MLTKRDKALVVAVLVLASVTVTSGTSMALDVGDEAPDFTLPATTGGKITLFPDLKVIQQYTGLMDTKAAIARRAFFLIDRRGIVRGRWFAEAGSIFPSEPILERTREIAGKR